MSKLLWKTLGLAALVAGSLQMATVGGAVAMTLPVPTSPGVESTSRWDDQLLQVQTQSQNQPNKKQYQKKKQSKQKKKYQQSKQSQPKKQYQNRKQKQQTKQYQKKKTYNSSKRHYYNKKYPNWRYDAHRYGSRYRSYRSGYGYYYGGYWYRRPWWTLMVPVVPYIGGSAHVQWCLNHYRSYNPRTDMYLGYDGLHHRCRPH